MSFQALVNGALLGTGRGPAPALDAPGELGDILGHPAATPETQLLQQAAALRLYELAGERPRRLERLPEPAPGDEQPTCSPAAAAHLHQILHGPYRAVLGEWAQAFAATGRALPHEHLVAVLDLATADRELAVTLDAALGARGRWLAEHSPQWGWARAGDVEERWQTGDRRERAHALRVLRSRDPAGARELLQSTWAQENGRDREAFLGTFSAGLSAADEALLEAALDGSQQAVRQTAARLLSALPGSALSRRMEARLRPLIDSGRRQLAVAAPAELTDDMRRDGITDKPPRRLARSSWIVEQLTAAAPLSTWDDVDRSPRKVIGRKIADGMREVLLAGWAEAATRQREAAWAQELLRHEPGRFGELLAVAGREHAEKLAIEQIRHGAGQVDGEWVPAPWSAEFSLRVFEQCRQDGVQAGLRALGTHGDPSAAGAIAAAVDRLDPALPVAAHGRDAAALLAFRETMLRTLTQEKR